MKNFTLKDLAVKHSYYMCEGNYFCSQREQQTHNVYYTWDEFYQEWHDADNDYNLLFRWDIKQHEETKNYYMSINYVMQRKAYLVSCEIKRLFEEDVPKIIEFLKPKHKYLNDLWSPIKEV